MRTTALLPAILVAVALAIAICVYPYMTNAHDAVAWPALTSFYSKDFRDAGFGIRCATSSRGTRCVVQWTNPTNVKAKAIDVYEIGSEQDLRRDDILLRFHAEATKAAGDEEASRVTAVLDAFFQSGLRRLADRGVRRASSRVESFQFPPFRLSSSRVDRGVEIRDVAGLDPSYSTILTGLPKRPAYRADVFASVSARGAGVSTVRIVPTRGNAVTRLLDPASTTNCDAIYPGARGADVPCKKLDITVCNPAADYNCRTSVLQVHAVGPGITLVRGGASAIGRPLSRGALPMSADEIIVARAENARFDPIHVEATDAYRDFRVEIIHGSRTPISRQRMVNGRWERWYEPTVRPWIEPLVTRWDTFARATPRLVDPQTPVVLSLDLSLQHELETKLAEWMKNHAEQKVVDHLAVWHYRHRSRSIDYRYGERNHRRAVPQAGVTVLDAQTGQILAVASYPPAEAYTIRNGEPAVAAGWRERFGGSKAPDWARRQILETLADRITEETNANFVTHPIGSTFKPILLSLMIDTAPPSGGSDQLASLFDLMIAGHPQVAPSKEPIACPACTDEGVQATVGFPVGPWGAEDGGGTHGNDDWIDRSEFIVASCNKYAITLGILSFMDWNRQGNQAACCWNTTRDAFAFVTGHNLGGGTVPFGTTYTTADQLPPFGPWIDAQTVSTNASFPDAPLFRRLRDYYDVSSRSLANAYDQEPFAPCVMPKITQLAQMPPMGTLARTQLMLTGQPIGPAFTNLFTGSGHNWWTNVKLAEAYVRLASNRASRAQFCGTKVPKDDLFRLTSRYEELMQIMSRQKGAHWVRIPAIENWIQQDAANRGTFSKTGTSLRQSGQESTGIFAIYVGNTTTAADGYAMRGGKGVVVVAHVDDLGTEIVNGRRVGASEQVTDLVNSLFEVLRTRIER